MCSPMHSVCTSKGPALEPYSTGLCRIEKNEDGTLTVHYNGKDGKEQSIVAGIVMFGTGRKPNTSGVGADVSAPARAAASALHKRPKQLWAAHAALADWGFAWQVHTANEQEGRCS